MRIYLSPSTQDHNAYAGGSNEETEMRHLAATIAPLLKAAGHTVKIGGTVSANANVVDSNAWKADWHIAVHTNAGGGVGTEVWYYPGSKQGERLASAIYKRLAPVTAKPDRGVKASKSYIETNGPNAPSVIIEAEFHDKAAGAAEIKTHHAEYARAIADGILEVAGGKVPKPKVYDSAYWWVDAEVPSSHKATFVADITRLGLKLYVRKGVGYAIIGLHAGDKVLPAVHAALARSGAVRIVQRRSDGGGEVAPDSTIRRLNAPTTTTL